MLRIGIDFDNTIACYDQVFQDVAAKMGFLAHSKTATKAAIKRQLLERPEGDLDWQRLQGQVYGRYMLQAEMFPGLFEFILLSKLRGHAVYIVSHKTEYGHFDPDRIPLRAQAMKWMETNHFFRVDGLSMQQTEVYFHATREGKLNRIRDLGCTHFIDDLEAVFTDRMFPNQTEPTLFCPGGNDDCRATVPTAASWREISARLHGDWETADIIKTVQTRFPDLGIQKASLKKGRGNSRIYQLSGNQELHALKIYPDSQHDRRQRLSTEFMACRFLKKLGLPVPQAIAIDIRLGWGVYQWVPGSPLEQPAGQSSVGLSFEQPVETFESISIANLNLLEAIRFLDMPVKLYNACSSEMFGNTNGAAVDEETKFQPCSPYGVAKAASYWQVANYREAYNLYACSGILFNHESFLRPKRFVTRKIITTACRIAAGHESRLILGDISIERDWGWAPEYVEGMWRMLQQETPDDYILATGETYCLESFIAAAFDALGLDWQNHVERDEKLLRPAEIKSIEAIPLKAEKKLSWKARYKMPDVVRMMVANELAVLKDGEEWN